MCQESLGRWGGFVLFDLEGILMILVIAIASTELVQCRDSGDDSEREVSLFVASKVFHGSDFTLFQIKFCIIIRLSNLRVPIIRAALQEIYLWQ